MRACFMEAVAKRVLLGDGAMGTMLQQAGLDGGGCGEAWNVDAPEKVTAIQCQYADAGSDCLITNSFGASRFRLSLHGEDARDFELNRAAALIARGVMGDDRYVLGDIGPFGGFLEPLGDTTREELLDAFMTQARGLAEGGADSIIIETMTSLEELGCAVEAARKVCSLPVIGSLAFDRILGGGYRTMMGVAPAQAARAMEAMGVDVVACNCGTGIGILDHAEIVREFRSVTALPIMAQPNAGQPELLDDRVVYHETPDRMAASVSVLVDAGAVVVGGCCGTTPEHIRLFRAALDRRAGA